MFIATKRYQRCGHQKKVLSIFRMCIQHNRQKLAVSTACTAEAAIGHQAGYQKKSWSGSKLAANTDLEPINRSAPPGMGSCQAPVTG